MPKISEPGIRYRISVPEQDTAVHEWIKNQLNVSMSIRMLIKDDINQNGYSDLTCRVNRELPKTAEKKKKKKVTAETSDVQKVQEVQEEVPKAQPSIFQTKPVGFVTEKKESVESEGTNSPFQPVERPVLSAVAMGLLDD